MSNQTLTLNIPASLYQRLKQRAERAQRPVEEEALVALAEAVPGADELPPELARALAVLPQQPDEALWQAARSRLSAEDAAAMEQFHLKRQREGLSTEEAERLAGLVRQYEQTMLVRAQATALLRQRGHDVTSLQTAP
jgi:hypothetical protein